MRACRLKYLIQLPFMRQQLIDFTRPLRRMRPGITPCVIKPAATYAEATARFHSPVASADA